MTCFAEPIIPKSVLSDWTKDPAQIESLISGIPEENRIILHYIIGFISYECTTLLRTIDKNIICGRFAPALFGASILQTNDLLNIFKIFINNIFIIMEVINYKYNI